MGLKEPVVCGKNSTGKLSPTTCTDVLRINVYISQKSDIVDDGHMQKLSMDRTAKHKQDFFDCMDLIC